jgi:cation:H+ antiporter
MKDMIEALLMLLGFALLIKGADMFVNASVAIAKKLKIPTVIIGLTVVAMGTGTPEAVISITASVQGANSLAIGNVVGSNIFNLIFIIGLCAVIRPIPFDLHAVSKDMWLSIGAAVLLLGLMLISGSYIPRWGSFVLLVVFLVYIFLLVRKAMKAHDAEDNVPQETIPQKTAPHEPGKQKHFAVIILLALLGCVLIVAGGQLTVDNATKIAVMLGVTERIIGLTIVAVGTSLPELVTSLVACKKGENEFALGNIIGSNIFNLMFILGIAGLISPLAFERALMLDMAFLIAGSLIAFLFIYTGNRLARREGFVMVSLYVGYMVFVMVG